MRRKRTLVAFGGIVAFLVVAMAVLNVAFSAWNVCENTIYQQLSSPMGKHRAVIFERNCGATTAFSTQLSVLGTYQELPNAPGNVLVMAGRPDVVPLQLLWLNETHLRIRRKETTIFRETTKSGVVKITFD